MLPDLVTGAQVGQFMLSEFMGTAILILLGAGVCANVGFNGSKAKGAGWLTVNFGWGLAVFSGVLVAFYSGGLLNPAVTLGLVFAKIGQSGPWTFGGTGAVPMNAETVILAIVAEFVGAFVGAILCYLAFFKQYNSEQAEGAKLGSFSTGPEIKSTGWNLVTEAIGTFVLVFVVLITGYQGNAGNLGWLNALGVALLIVAIGNSLGGPTGYAINPARDLGPRIAFAVLPMKNGKGGANWSYSWIPVVGPVIGGIVAGLIYALIHLAPWA